MRVLVLGTDIGPELARALSESRGGQGGRPHRAGTREPELVPDGAAGFQLSPDRAKQEAVTVGRTDEGACLKDFGGHRVGPGGWGR